MNCAYHENVKAKFICQDCGANICNDCAVNNNGDIICLECANEKGLLVMKNKINNEVDNYNINNNSTKNQERKISTFWTTIFSFIPGAGHMYLGMMKRGFQLMVGFFLMIGLASSLYSSDIFNFFAVVIWFYNVFDCYNIRKRIKEGKYVEEDVILDINIKNINLLYLGIGLIAFGGIVLIDELFTRLMFMLNRSGIYYDIFRIIRSSVVPVLLIVCGIFMLKKHKKSLEA